MKLIPNAVTMRCARQLLIGKKNSPTLLFGAGVIGVVGSTVLACRATLKLEEVITEAQNDLHIAHNLEHEDYSEQDRKKDVAIIYVRTLGKAAVLYGPAVCLGVASIGALTASHNILSKRNVALTAAYAALEKGFAEYRERVVDKYGEQQDREFRYATEKVDVVNDKGRKVKELRVAPGADSIYARFFDESNANWNQDAEINLIFLKAQQNYLNNLLVSRGHVFLNEVYKDLGMAHSNAGAAVGWVYGDDGDNFIDFGIFDGNGASRAFVNGQEGSILLDFNVDGAIWDKIDGRRKGLKKWQN